MIIDPGNTGVIEYLLVSRVANFKEKRVGLAKTEMSR